MKIHGRFKRALQVGETGTQLSIQLVNDDGTFPSIDSATFRMIADDDAGTVFVNDADCLVLGDGIVSYPPVSNDVSLAGRYFCQFICTLSGSAGTLPARVLELYIVDNLSLSGPPSPAGPSSGSGFSGTPVSLEIYVDSALGNDDTGTGSSLLPFATVDRVNTLHETHAAIEQSLVHLVGAHTYPLPELNMRPFGAQGRLGIVGDAVTVLATGLTAASGSSQTRVLLTASSGIHAYQGKTVECLAATNAANVGARRTIRGYQTKFDVDIATTANITLSGHQTIDGQSTTGKRVLVKNQTTASQNGIYNDAAGAWTRALDADDKWEVEAARVTVLTGTVNAGLVYFQTATNVAVGTDAQTWTTNDVVILTDRLFPASVSSGDTFRIFGPAASVTLPATPLAQGAGMTRDGGAQIVGGLYLSNIAASSSDSGYFWTIGTSITGLGVEVSAGITPYFDNSSYFSGIYYDLSWLGAPSDAAWYGWGTVFTDQFYCAPSSFLIGVAHLSGGLQAGSNLYNCEVALYGGRCDGNVSVIDFQYRTLEFQGLFPNSFLFQSCSVTTSGPHVYLAATFSKVTGSALIATFPGVFGLDFSEGLRGHCTGYGADASKGGRIDFDHFQSVPTLSGDLGQAHITSRTATWAELSGKGMGDYEYPFATGAAVLDISRSGAPTAGTLSPVRSVSGTSIAVQSTDRLLIVDNSAAVASIQMPDPATRYKPLSIACLADPSVNAVTLLRHGSENIDLTASNYALSTFAVTVDCDLTDYYIVPSISSGGGGSGGAPDNAQYLTAASNGTLTAERVATDTTTVAWDFATSGQAKANVPDGSLAAAKLAFTVTAAAQTVLDDTTVSAMVDTLGGTAATGTGGIVRASSPTIVTPTIASFANANHSHQDSAGGGTLDAAAIATGVLAIGRLATGTPDGTKFVRDDGTLAVPAGSGDMVLASTQTNTGAKSFNSGTLKLNGSSSGTTTLNAAAAAGAGTVTLPTTGTLATLAGSETLTNKTITTPTITFSTTAGITASTTQTQGQGALTSDINEVSTCANANDTVTLPAAGAGKRVEVINNGAQTLQIFPASGQDLGAGTDTAITIGAGGRILFFSYSSTKWVRLGVSAGTVGGIPVGGSGGTLAISWIPTGSSSSTVCIGNDSRLSDSRAPTGSAGGDLSGTYPNPTVVAGSTSTAGKLQIIDSISSTSTTTAASPNSVKTAYDLANAALALNGGTMTGALISKAVVGITASTTQTQGQGALTGDVNQISTCANANDTVTLPSVASGKLCIVCNDGAQTLKIYPASGHDLGGGTNTSTTLVAGGRLVFRGVSSTKWDLESPLGTTTVAGLLSITDSTASTSTTTAASPNSVKTAYDLANAALPKAGGTMTGPIHQTPTAITLSSNTATLDATVNNSFQVATALAASFTLTVSNGTDGDVLNIAFKQDGTGGRKLTGLTISGRTIVMSPGSLTTINSAAMIAANASFQIQFAFYTAGGTAYTGVSLNDTVAIAYT